MTHDHRRGCGSPRSAPRSSVSWGIRARRTPRGDVVVKLGRTSVAGPASRSRARADRGRSPGRRTPRMYAAGQRGHGPEGDARPVLPAGRRAGRASRGRGAVSGRRRYCPGMNDLLPDLRPPLRRWDVVITAPSCLIPQGAAAALGKPRSWVRPAGSSAPGRRRGPSSRCAWRLSTGPRPDARLMRSWPRRAAAT